MTSCTFGQRNPKLTIALHRRSWSKLSSGTAPGAPFAPTRCKLAGRRRNLLFCVHNDQVHALSEVWGWAAGRNLLFCVQSRRMHATSDVSGCPATRNLRMCVGAAAMHAVPEVSHQGAGRNLRMCVDAALMRAVPEVSRSPAARNLLFCVCEGWMHAEWEVLAGRRLARSLQGAALRPWPGDGAGMWPKGISSYGRRWGAWPTN